MLIILFSIILGYYKIKEWLYSYCSDSLSYIKITGNVHITTDDDIRNALTELKVLGTFITQDVDIVQKKIEQLPWIKQVSVRKQWPDTLKIHLIEYIPVAYWNDDCIISTIGTIFKASHQQLMDKNIDNIKYMPVLYGPESKAHEILNNYLIFREILKSNKLQIKSVNIDIYFSWQLKFIDGIYLKLGRENIIERLCYFITIYPVLFQKIYEKNKCIDYVDLRYRSGFVVKWMNQSITPISFYNK